LSRLDDHSGYVTGVLAPIMVIAIGLGLTFVPLVLGVTSGVQPDELGVASAVLNTAQQVGGTLGLAILVTIAAGAAKNALDSVPRHGTPGPDPPGATADWAIAEAPRPEQQLAPRPQRGYRA